MMKGQLNLDLNCSIKFCAICDLSDLFYIGVLIKSKFSQLLCDGCKCCLSKDAMNAKQ